MRESDRAAAEFIPQERELGKGARTIPERLSPSNNPADQSPRSALKRGAAFIRRNVRTAETSTPPFLRLLPHRTSLQPGDRVPPVLGAGFYPAASSNAFIRPSIVWIPASTAG